MNEVQEFCRDHYFASFFDMWALKRTSMAEVYDECPNIEWLIALLQSIGKITKAQAVAVAISGAEKTLPAFEAAHPDDRRPRAAIGAARAWLESPNMVGKDALYSAAKDAYPGMPLMGGAPGDAIKQLESIEYRASLNATNAAFSAWADDVRGAVSMVVQSSYKKEESAALADELRRMVPNPWREAGT